MIKIIKGCNIFIISLLVIFSSSSPLEAQNETCQDRIDKDIPPSEIWIEVLQFWSEYDNHPGRP